MVFFRRDFLPYILKVHIDDSKSFFDLPCRYLVIHKILMVFYDSVYLENINLNNFNSLESFEGRMKLSVW